MESKEEAGGDDVQHGDGEKELPAEVHELVVAEARQGGADPNVKEEKGEDLGDEPEHGEDGRENGAAEVVREQVPERAGCAAEEEQRSDAADGDHVGVFGHEEHGELHGAVLGVVSGGEFGFGFGKVEGRTVGLGVGGHEVDEEGDELEAAEDVPGERAVGGLDVDDVAQAEGAGAKDDADEREAEGELVADDLGGGTERSQERVLIVRRPAGEGDAVDADRGDAKDDEQADVDVSDLEEVNAVDPVHGAEGDNGDRDEGAGEGDNRGGEEKWALHGERHEVFLEEELDAIDEWLQQAEGADAAGAPAVLHAADDLAFEQHGVGDGGERDDEHHEDLHNREQNEDLELGEAVEEVGHVVAMVSSFGALTLRQVALRFRV